MEGDNANSDRKLAIPQWRAKPFTALDLKSAHFETSIA